VDDAVHQALEVDSDFAIVKTGIARCHVLSALLSLEGSERRRQREDAHLLAPDQKSRLLDTELSKVDLLILEVVERAVNVVERLESIVEQACEYEHVQEFGFLVKTHDVCCMTFLCMKGRENDIRER
jgi:hypothetical protein